MVWFVSRSSAQSQLDSSWEQSVDAAARAAVSAMSNEAPALVAVADTPDARKQAENQLTEAVKNALKAKLEKPVLQGFVTAESILSVTVMVPVVSAGALLFDKLITSNREIVSQNWLAFWISIVVVILMTIATWPSFMADRDSNARTAMAIGFAFLNAIILTSAAIGLADVAEDTADDSGDGAGQETPTPTPEASGGSPFFEIRPV